MLLNGENCQNVIDRKTSWKWANGLNNIYDSEKRTPGAGLPPPRDNIHVYYHNIQRSFSLKLLGQSKPNVLLSILRKVE